MANRRCFSKDIVCSDDFYDLPISSQALYFHLGMQADDRGYINNARSIIKIIGSSSGDLEALIQKKFVLVRNNNLILIKGWRINNTIQPSRLVETNYTEDLKTLFFDENNSYTESKTDTPCQQVVDKLSTSCQQNVDVLSTQYNLSKDNLSKDKKENIIKESENVVNNQKNEEINEEEIQKTINDEKWTAARISQALKLKDLYECGICLTQDELKELDAFVKISGSSLEKQHL